MIHQVPEVAEILLAIAPEGVARQDLGRDGVGPP